MRLSMLIGPFLVVMAMTMLLLGIRVCTRRPFILDSRVFFALIALGCFLPPVLALFSMLYDLVDLGFSNSWPIYAMAPVIMVSLFLMKKSLGHFVVFNVTKDSLHESVLEALSKNELKYEERRSHIMVRGINASIKVTMQAGGKMAGLVFLDARDIPNLRRILVDLRSSLSVKKLEGSPAAGIAFVAMAILLLLMGLLWWRYRIMYSLLIPR